MQLGPGDQPFLTQDSILAFALYLAFTMFGDDDMPCVNYYTLDDLRNLGYKGILPQAAALKAVEDGSKGVVEYMFKQPLDGLHAAFEDQKKVIEEGEGLARDQIKSLIDDYKNGAREYEEMIVRVACTLVFMRAEFLTMWQKMEPLLRHDDLDSTTQNMPDGSRVVTFGGFRFVGARASKETLERVGIC
jgi:hypothetical protein